MILAILRDIVEPELSKWIIGAILLIVAIYAVPCFAKWLINKIKK